MTTDFVYAADLPMECTRFVYDGCAGDGGYSCRDCPGRAERAARLADINARQQAQRSKSGRWINLGIIAVLAAIFIGAITPQAVENWHNVRVANVQP